MFERVWIFVCLKISERLGRSVMSIFRRERNTPCVFDRATEFLKLLFCNQNVCSNRRVAELGLCDTPQVRHCALCDDFRLRWLAATALFRAHLVEHEQLFGFNNRYTTLWLWPVFPTNSKSSMRHMKWIQQNLGKRIYRLEAALSCHSRRCQGQSSHKRRWSGTPSSFRECKPDTKPCISFAILRTRAHPTTTSSQPPRCAIRSDLHFL